LVDQAELHRKSLSSAVEERKEALKQIVINFAELPDKQAWNDMHRLSQDEDSFVRYEAARSLGSAFSQVQDKEQAWADLHRLTKDEDSIVRAGAAWSLGRAFSQVLDKEQAWADLHRLTKDEDSSGRIIAAMSLGSAFSQVPDKEQAWIDMIRLTKDEDSNVRVYANHYLGRASVFRATEAEREEDFRKELETALCFFEKASTEATFINPAEFCLPFYRSFYGHN